MNRDGLSCGLIFGSLLSCPVTCYLWWACHSSFSLVGIIDLSNLKYMHHTIWPLPLSQCLLYTTCWYWHQHFPTWIYFSVWLYYICLLSVLKFLQIQSKLFILLFLSTTPFSHTLPGYVTQHCHHYVSQHPTLLLTHQVDLGFLGYTDTQMERTL